MNDPEYIEIRGQKFPVDRWIIIKGQRIPVIKAAFSEEVRHPDGRIDQTIHAPCLGLAVATKQPGSEE